jgi:hypothetical protein
MADFLFAVLLSSSLLFTQWLGLSHKVAHAEQYQAAVTKVFSSSVTSGQDGKLSHSCLLFDAVTLGAALQTAIYAGLLLRNQSAKLLATPLRSWSAPFSSHFCPRAPPSTLI